MLVRLLLGLLKGAVIGGGVGYGAHALGLDGGFHWVTYGLVGVCVGLLVGRPVWSHLFDPHSTALTSILKAGFGYGVCVAMFALVANAWGGFDLEIAGETRNLYDWTFVLGAAIGGVYGAWVEADDAPPPGKGKGDANKSPS